ncbi:MAG: molybdopterin-guanine dinucleotide biosynthesis protein [Thermoleophilia bacterium]|nr:molybdopterin-guanine dinucleotide biosynthesis protein [Thermoleophilia bacterium]
MHEWLERAHADLAAAVGDDPAGYTLAQADIDILLELARAAAHGSGERQNAPLATYLVGLAHGRHPSRNLGALADVAAGPGA